MEAQSRMERKKQEARARIFRAAKELFLREDGYDKTTMRDIAQLADVSTGALYMHLTSTPGVMAALLDNIIASNLKALGAAVYAQKTGIKKITAYIDHFLRIAKDAQFHTYLQYIHRLNPGDVESSIVASMKEKARIFYGFLRDGIALGQADGSVKKLGDPGLMAQVIQATLRGFQLSLFKVGLEEPGCAPFSGFSEEDIFKIFRAMILSSIRKEKKKEKKEEKNEKIY
jgi:AcrR family transcriptional regulator